MQIFVRTLAPPSTLTLDVASSDTVDAIAGLCDPTGRVLGLMPHPERNVTPWHHPHWTRLGERSEGEGLPFFRSLVEYAAQSADLPITTEA